MDTASTKHGEEIQPEELAPGRVVWHGHFWTSIPGCGPVTWHVADAWFPEMDPRQSWSHREWTICCYRTPCFIRVGARENKWFPSAGKDFIYLYPPHAAITVDSVPTRTPFHSLWVHFSGGEEFNMDRFVSPRHGYACIHDPDGIVADRIKHMAEVAHELETQAFWLENDLLTQLLAILNRAVPAAKNQWTIPANVLNIPLHRDHMVDAAVRHMAAHLNERITLDSLARHLKAGKTTLNTRYRQAMHETPIQTLRRLRINKARFLLANGNNMDWVASQTGFCDAFHLSRVFKQLTCMSPKTFLKTLRPEPES